MLLAPKSASAQIETESGAPKWTVAEDTSVKVKEHLEQTFRAEDPEGDPLTYTIEGLPVGATAEANNISASTSQPNVGITISWTPGDADVGTYELTLKASDGRHTAERQVKLVVEEEINSFVMPGVEYALYVPNDDHPPEKLGIFQGVTVEFCVWCYIHRTDKRGPSHGKIYISFDLLASTEKTSSALFMANVGFDLSLEKNPARRFLIPFFGGEMGIYYQKQTETLGMTLPFAGLHLWASANFQLNLRAGYLLPFTSGRFDQTRGLRANLGFNVAFW
jgi:Putative Ig domain